MMMENNLVLKQRALELVKNERKELLKPWVQDLTHLKKVKLSQELGLQRSTWDLLRAVEAF